MKNLHSKFLVAILALTLAACQPAEESVTKIPADLILSNGKIVSVDEAFNIFDTVVVSDGKIVELGDASLLDKYDVDYVYVGPVEKRKYNMQPRAAERFDRFLTLVYDEGAVQIYQR